MFVLTTSGLGREKVFSVVGVCIVFGFVLLFIDSVDSSCMYVTSTHHIRPDLSIIHPPTLATPSTLGGLTTDVRTHLTFMYVHILTIHTCIYRC